MSNTTDAGVRPRAALSADDIQAIRELATACDRQQPLDHRISWEGLGERGGERPEDWLFFQGGALAGYLFASGLGAPQAEVGALVHPDHRRRGVFRALLGAAREECLRQGTTELLLVADRQSAAAPAVAAAVGAALEFSEHLMVRDDLAAPPLNDSRIEFRAAGPQDAEAVAQILAEDDTRPAEQLLPLVLQRMREPRQQHYLASDGGAPVGTIRIEQLNGVPYIYGFVVSAGLRGRGYGRQILAHALAAVAAERPQPVYLEVESANTPALALYQSSGFRFVRTHDYYLMGV